MDRSEIRQYEMLVRVRDFGNAQRELFPETSLAGQAFTTVDGIVKPLGEHAVSQMRSRPRRAGTPTARQAVLSGLHEISRTARTLKAADPSFDNKFRPPRPQPSQSLIAAGRAFASDLAPLADRFVAREMPPTFIDDLIALVETLEARVHARSDQKLARAAARVQFQTALATGIDVAQTLDVLVRNRLKRDPVTLTAWEVARHIEEAYPDKTTPGEPSSAPQVTPTTSDTTAGPTTKVPDGKAA